MKDSSADLMTRASQALVRMDYLTCERLSVQALHLARSSENWTELARILLPLQEARRQRRLVAADTAVRLGCKLDEDDGQTAGAQIGSCAELTLRQLLEGRVTGCVLLTGPGSMETATKLVKDADESGLYLEVMVTESSRDSLSWDLRSLGAPEVFCPVDAPPADLQGRWIEPQPSIEQFRKAAAWFLAASEKLGDAVRAGAPSMDYPVERADYLLKGLDAVRDHERLHQDLADTAALLARA